jgi:hypothetical protein
VFGSRDLTQLDGEQRAGRERIPIGRRKLVAGASLVGKPAAALLATRRHSGGRSRRSRRTSGLECLTVRPTLGLAWTTNCARIPAHGRHRARTCHLAVRPAAGGRPTTGPTVGVGARHQAQRTRHTRRRQLITRRRTLDHLAMTNRAGIPPRRNLRARSRQRTVRPAVRGRLPTSLSVTRRLGRGRARLSHRDACARGPTVRPILYLLPVRPILGCIPATGPSVGWRPRGRYRDRACDGRIAVLVPRRSVVPALPCGCGARPWLGPAWASSRITRHPLDRTSAAGRGRCGPSPHPSGRCTFTSASASPQVPRGPLWIACRRAGGIASRCPGRFAEHPSAQLLSWDSSMRPGSAARLLLMRPLFGRRSFGHLRGQLLGLPGSGLCLRTIRPRPIHAWVGPWPRVAFR